MLTFNTPLKISESGNEKPSRTVPKLIQAVVKYKLSPVSYDNVWRILRPPTGLKPFF